MVYGLASKGFRPGGVVPIVPPGTPGTPNDCVAALAEVNPSITLADTRSFHSDSLWNYEIGTKNAFLDHRVVLNAAAFSIRWNNIQQAVGKNLTNEVTNLGDNRSIAAEVPGRPRLFINQPLTLGVEFIHRFH
jgi:outer membrane receptor protein involved in Fe transport